MQGCSGESAIFGKKNHLVKLHRYNANSYIRSQGINEILARDTVGARVLFVSFALVSKLIFVKQYNLYPTVN